MSPEPKAEKQKARTSLRAISNTGPVTAASGFIWGGRKGIGILLPQNQQDPEDGLARAGWTAKRAAPVYTRRKKTQVPQSDLLSWPSASAGNCAGVDSEAELPGRGLGGSLHVRGGARSIPVYSESKAGQGAGRCLRR